MTSPEDIARRFHEVYEKLAPDYSYETREESAVPWEDVPANNKNLMIAVATQLMDEFGMQKTGEEFRIHPKKWVYRSKSHVYQDSSQFERQARYHLRYPDPEEGKLFQVRDVGEWRDADVSHLT